MLWDPTNNPFLNKSDDEVISELSKKFHSTCKINQKENKEKSVIISGCDIKVLKGYMTEHYKIPNIPIAISTTLVPQKFKITISGKLGTKATKIEWETKIWCDQFFDQFLENLSTFVSDEINSKLELEFQSSYTTRYCIKKDDIDKKITKFLKFSWNMKPTQIIYKMDPRDKEPIPPVLESKIIKNPYKKIKKMIKSAENIDQFTFEMGTTIIEYRKFQKRKFKSHQIRRNLIFHRSGSNVSKKERSRMKNNDKIINFWITTFKGVNEDDDKRDFNISEGDTVIVNYKDEKTSMQGRVVSNYKGIIKAIFSINDGSYPLGYSIGNAVVDTVKKETKNKKKKAKNDDDDDDYNNTEDTITSRMQ